MQRVLAVLVLGVAASLSAGESQVWWEGEDTVATNFPQSTWFDARNPSEAEKLSGGDWLTHIEERKAGDPVPYAAYDVAVPETATYDLWVRKLWKHGPFRWRFDDRPWRTVGRDIALADSVVLRTHVPANWVYIGEAALPRGRHEFRIELLAEPGEARTSGFDAFLLTTGAFLPRGKLKPGERYGRAEPGFFAFEPGLDEFTDNALLDLRSMNEPVAGMHGRLERDDDAFVLGDGTPVRFWAANVSAGNAAQRRASIDYLARKLAKLGVNMVRYHSGMMPHDGDWSRLRPDAVDNLQYLVHALKQQGIYTEISFFFPLWFNAQAAGFEGFDKIDNNKPFALLFFNERLQRMHRGWLRQMLTRPNPYTNVPLAEDPAVGLIEIVNEDSLLFWTFSKKNVPAVYWRELERGFGEWLIDAYGSIARARQAWGGGAMDGDAPDQRTMAVREAWFMTGGGLDQLTPPQRARMRDQVRFLAHLQRDFYQQTTEWLRDELGYNALVAASNWQTADRVRLDRVERWSYVAGDVIDRHGYVSGKVEGEGASYSVRVGHRYEDMSVLRHPGRCPVQAMQVRGHPQMISELGWPNPNRYRGEGTTLGAVLAARQGIDALHWFAVESNFVNPQTMAKFSMASPAVAGTFPATALMYRRGDVTTPPPAVLKRFDESSLFSLEPESQIASVALDALRESDVPEDQRPAAAAAAAAATFQRGPMVRVFGEKPVKVDRPSASVTDEVRWDEDAGVLTVDTPRTQGAVGFLEEGAVIELGDVGLTCGNAFASVLVVSLDGEPIATSKRLLVQAFTEERPYGYRVEGGRITDLGQPPFGVRKIDASVTLSGPPASKVTAIDPNGYPTDKAVTTDRVRRGTRVRLAPGALYHVIER